MANIIKLLDVNPVIHHSCWLAQTATLIGKVYLQAGVTVWYNTVLRADVCDIRIGENTNIQDNTTVHGSYGYSHTIIGADVSIGHNCVIHGCIIHDQVLIGMGAIIMDNAVIQSHVIVGAGAVVLANAVLESGYIYAGAPAKKIKAITSDQIQKIILQGATNYSGKYVDWYREAGI